MVQKRKKINAWVEELKEKITDEKSVSNKDIVDFINEKDLSKKELAEIYEILHENNICLLYTSPSPRDGLLSRMPSSA